MSEGLQLDISSDSAAVRYVVVDVETTGLSAFQGHEMCEVAALAVVGGRIRESFGTLLNPGRSIPPEASAVNGITDEMVKDAPSMREVSPGLLEFLGKDSVIVIHNAPFDMSFIQSKLIALGLQPLSNLVIDTLVLAKREFGAGGNSLGQLARRLSLEQGTPHRALGDTETTARLFLYFLEKCRERGLLTVGALGARAAEYYTHFAIVRPPEPRPRISRF